MYDTREPNLELQAFNAIHGHAQNTREPTALELDLIKEFQQTDSRFFSSEALRAFAPVRSSAATAARHHRVRTARARDVRQRAVRWRDDQGHLQYLSLGTDA